MSLTSARAQSAAPEAPVTAPVAAEPFPAAPAAAPVLAGGPTGSDHDVVVGKWGIEVRKIGDFARTAGQDVGCGTPCLTSLNALSLRRWSEHDYAYSFGLALGVGGGATRPVASGGAQTWDTYFGVGPTVAANFLITAWKHLTVSYGPQAEFVFFLPSGKGSKSFLVNLRGLVEGELHLGMIGVPSASVALSTGIDASYLFATKDKKENAMGNLVANRWTLAVSGPQAFWDLVTKVNLRYYF